MPEKIIFFIIEKGFKKMVGGTDGTRTRDLSLDRAAL